MGIESGVLKDGAYYWLRTTDRSKPCTIIVYPSEEALRVTSSPFTSAVDPEFWFGHWGTAVEAFCQNLYEARKNADSRVWSVSRSEDVVITEINSPLDGGKRFINRLEIDLSKGANLRRFVGSDDNVEQEWTWNHEQVAGVWVPKEISVRHEQKSPRATTTRKMTWKNVINEVVTDEAFSFSAMGAQPDDVVSDHRSGVKFALSATELAKETEPTAATRSTSWIVTFLAVAIVLVLVLAAFLFIRAKKRPTGEAA